MSAESNSTCPVCRTAEVVCGKWTLLLIRDLAEGSGRFCELERSLEGISPRTLSLRLRALEARPWCHWSKTCAPTAPAGCWARRPSASRPPSE
jgi:DNA-binding HxlR family transcriptional regulator